MNFPINARKTKNTILHINDDVIELFKKGLESQLVLQGNFTRKVLKLQKAYVQDRRQVCSGR